MRLASGYQFREDGIVEHLERISAYVTVLASACGRPAEEVALLRRAAVFHDVGMVDVPEAVLRKEGKLDEGETALMRRHAELGRELLGEAGSPLLREAALLAWTHHECFDGGGYPRGLRADEIPFGARVLAVADVFDALTTRRAFKDAYPVDVAFDIVRGGAGRRFDPDVVAALEGCRADVTLLAERLATPERPSRTGFRISARDMADGAVLDATGDAYFSCPFCRGLHPRTAEFCPKSREPLRTIHKLSGRVVGERYKVREGLGVGGMAAVYEARHLLIERRLAIKFLDLELAHSPESVARFCNEARFVSAVGHPNLVQVTDMGETVEGIPFIVMELLEGRGLGDLLRERKRPARLAAVTVAIEILRTLSAVHAKGIVHRDLKPDNVFLLDESGEPRLKVLDFGISLLVGDEARSKRLTQVGEVLGTPQYMSPEQARGRTDIDHRSDLFTVGAILYEMLVGRPVFDGPNPYVIAGAVALCDFQRPGELVDGLDPALERTVLRALEREPADRFQTAEEFLEPLRASAARDPRYREGRILDLGVGAERSV
ncbi:MAG: protein kinase [Deltaproteobacteria bacterium]|nr:protein kinase [Deltaproteobacteria bacterium]